MRPNPSWSGNNSSCRGRNPPPESTRYRHGSRLANATDCARRCFGQSVRSEAGTHPRRQARRGRRALRRAGTAASAGGDSRARRCAGRGRGRRVLSFRLALRARDARAPQRRLRRTQLRRLLARVEPLPGPAPRALATWSRPGRRRSRGTPSRESGRARSSRRSSRASPRAARRVRRRGPGSTTQLSTCAAVTSGWNCTPQHASPSRNACVHASLRASSTAPAGTP